jgi:replication-associated recombination protein RarA
MHPQTYGLISSYLKEYKKRIRRRTGKLDEPEKSIIIQGLLGSGKTHFVRQIAEDFSVRILELNSSYLRSKGNVGRILGEASQTFSIDHGENNGTMIFIDDVDIILEPDKGFYQGIESVISNTKCPVIMTCEKVPELLINNCHIRVYKLNSHKMQALEIMKNIRNTQSIFMTDIEIEHLYNKAKGNLNTIMNFMWTKVNIN